MAYSSIAKPGDHFNTVLYSGNDSTNNITGVGFQPDWVWIKNRSNSSSHNIFDSVRGATKAIFTNATDAEATEASRLSAFNSDGFTLNGDTSNQTNANGSNFASFNWKAGGATTTNPSGGTITTTASVNTTAGFSVFTYTGNGSAAHIAHGLGVAPTLVIIKGRSNADNWFVKHPGIDANQYVYTNSTGATQSGSNVWSATNPDATKIYIGTDAGVNANGYTYVCYAFAEKKGYSKFGSYIGNGNANGTFVYTGFKPAFVINKRTDSSTGGSWILQDNKRGNNVRNPVDLSLSPTNNQTESDWGDTFDCDYLSNGFKWRMDGTGGYNNTSGAAYIYLAFAEHPFVGNDSGSAVPVVAR
jgi:hypothetical protein